MSSELERLLREARGTLRGPTAAATRRARALALAAAVGKRRHRARSAAVGAALLLATGIGVGLGALLAPSGSAAPDARGVGFLPEQGWSVLANGGDGTPARPATAIAANVALRPDDDPDGLPYATLLALPPDGIVIIAEFVERGERWRDGRFPRRSLPLRIGDAAPFIEWGVQVRPERPLGQYQLLAGVNGYNVDVNVYFGTRRPPRAVLAAAQRQLDGLIVRRPAAGRREDRTRQPAAAAVAIASTSTVDRTFSCATVSVFGDRFARVGASARTPTWPASASVATGAAGTIEALAGLEAGPSSGRTTGNVYFNWKRCRSTSAVVPLTSRGLPGPPVEFGQAVRCPSGARVLVRLRAAIDRSPRWRRQGDVTVASGNLSDATLALRTTGGKPLALASISAGRLKLYMAPGCE